MTITNIQQAKRDKERVNIFVDGQFAFGLDKNTLMKVNLYKGKSLDPEELTEIAERDTVFYLSRKLLAWCFKRPRSVLELKLKLKERLSKRESLILGEVIEIDHDQIVAKVLKRLAAQGCTDEQFGAWFVQERVRQEKYGPQKIISDLVQKGVDSRLAAQIVDQEYPQDLRDQYRQQVLSTKFGVDSVSEIQDFKNRTKAMNFLRSRGF